MNYYEPTSLKSCQEMAASLKDNGFNAEISIFNYIIKRETSKYNKYMKWHVCLTVDDRMISSNYFKSKPKAIEYLAKNKRPLPTGNGFSITHHIIKEATQ